MRVIVTRVQPQAARWVHSLATRFDAVALPLLEIGALADTAALQAAGRSWADYNAVKFVSIPAVEFFFASNQALALANKGQIAITTRAWAPGLGTRDALFAHGVSPHLVDAPAPDGGQFDSEALWQQVHQQITPGSRVLVVRGDSPGADDSKADRSGAAASGASGVQGVGREWMAQTLREAGASVDFVVAYQRRAPVWGEAERALATQAATDGSVWLFSSAEAAGHLRSLLPHQSWAQARAVATHPRIAQTARDLGFAVVLESRPTLADTLASIESLA